LQWPLAKIIIEIDDHTGRRGNENGIRGKKGNGLTRNRGGFRIACTVPAGIAFGKRGILTA